MVEFLQLVLFSYISFCEKQYSEWSVLREVRVNLAKKETLEMSAFTIHTLLMTTCYDNYIMLVEPTINWFVVFSKICMFKGH